MLDNWQRIEQIIKWTGFASVSAFARDIGLNRSENLYQIKRGNNGISKDLAETITNKYPQISKAWLLTGEGDMIPQSRPKPSPDIPFYKIDATQLVLYEDNPQPSYYVSMPIFKGSDFAAFTFSASMEPEVPRGSMLFFQSSAPEKLMPGEMYLIVSDSFHGIRTVRKDPVDTDRLRLVPRNSAEFDEVVIDQNEIKQLFVVRGVVINRSI